MNIFLHELRSYRKSTAIWTVALSVGVIIFLTMFPAFSKDVEASRKVLENFPPTLRTAFGLSLENFFTVYGFFAYLFTFISLGGAVQAMNLGVGVISKEESGKTVDFLLTKPVSRSNIMVSKVLAVLFSLLITNIVFSLTGLIMAGIVTTDDFSAKTFLLISFTLFLVQLFFVALGVLFSVTLKKVKSVVSVSLPTVFTFFIIGTLGAIIGNDNARYLSPFKFFDPMYIIDHNFYEIKFLLIDLIFIVITTVISFIVYLKKDIRSAA